MINSYSQIPTKTKKRMQSGKYEVKNLGNSIYKCDGFTIKVPFGECPEVMFYNLFCSN